MTILVVDDDAECRSALASLLSIEGHQVWTADNGWHALEVLRVNGADVVLLDLTMPYLDGKGFLKEKRRDPAVAATRTIVVSATRARASDLRALGADDVLLKPIDPERLLTLLTTPDER